LYVCFKRNNFTFPHPAPNGRETILHPQLRCCQNKKRLCLQCKPFQQNQQIVLRISFLNSTFPSKGTKKEHAFCPGHHASHICHRSYCGFANNRFQFLGYELSNENEQCSEAHAYLETLGNALMHLQSQSLDVGCNTLSRVKDGIA